MNDSDKKALLSGMLPGASGFLEATPSKDHGLAWEPTVFVTEIRTRLQHSLFREDDWCPVCERVLDRKGRHPATAPDAATQRATKSAFSPPPLV